MPSNPPSPERIEEVFHRALDLPPVERPALLAEACQGDDALRQTVEELLHSADAVGANSAWHASALENEAAALSHSGAELDRYRLAGRIGAGGMGMVYKASRADDVFSKSVAIKIVQESDPALVARFLRERQILARLEHPNIARLLDGGSTAEGLPFLVMEYVDGVPIDQYVAQTAPARRDLLSLFRLICSAVSYAHANLVVHRDLKPGNILVTAEGQPKLLDFGVAKLLDGSPRTRTGAGAMTPEYASPEQVQGAPITTASDIYSLGVLLYELLTGKRLYQNTASALELANEICTVEAEPLSVRAGRRFDPDLERIVSMALRKEPERRYASVEQFSEDLRRYLEGYPVLARPATHRYRVSKFIGRNRTAALAAAAVLLTLLGGIGATAWEARAANRRFNQVRKLANSYLFEFYDGIRDLPGSTPTLRLVVKRALEYLDSLAQERSRDAALNRELGTAYLRVADVQGYPNWPNLGDLVGALASYRKSLSLRRRLAESSPTSRDLAGDLAEVYSRIGVLVTHTGDLVAAAQANRQAIAILEKLAAANAGDPNLRDSLANGYVGLGDVTGNSDVPNLGDPQGALSLFRKAVAIRERLSAELPADRKRRLWLAVSYGRLGSVLQALDEKVSAAQAFRQAAETDERLVSEDPVDALYRREAAVYQRSLSLLLIRSGLLEEARARGNRSAELFEALAREDPENVAAREALADSRTSQGVLLAADHDPRGAFRRFKEAVGLYRELIVAHPNLAPPGLRMAYQRTADLAVETKDTAKAMEFAHLELQLDEKLLARNSANASALRNQGVAYMQIGQANELRAQFQEARNWFQRSLDVWVSLQAKGTLIPAYASRLGDARQALARCDTALRPK